MANKTITGWNGEPFISKGNVINMTAVYLCTAERRALCTKEKRCHVCAPRSAMHEHWKLTQTAAGERELAKILRDCWKQCHKITLTIIEEK